MEDAVTDIKDLVFSENQEKESLEEQSSTGGVLNNLVSALVSKPEEEEKGGVVNNFITNLISPKSSPRVRGDTSTTKEKFDELEEDLGGDGGGGGRGGGGIVKNLVSSIFHQSEGEGEEKENDDEQKGGGGGVIANLVSHLPTPIADDAAPTSDEASILIHSIVHD